MIFTERVMVEQLDHFLPWLNFFGKLWSEGIVSLGLEYFVRLVRCSGVPRKPAKIPPWPRLERGFFRGLGWQMQEVDVSDGVLGILKELVRENPLCGGQLLGSYYKESEWKRAETELNEMWKVVI